MNLFFTLLKCKCKKQNNNTKWFFGHCITMKHQPDLHLRPSACPFIPSKVLGTPFKEVFILSHYVEGIMHLLVDQRLVDWAKEAIIVYIMSCVPLMGRYKFPFAHRVVLFSRKSFNGVMISISRQCFWVFQMYLLVLWAPQVWYCSNIII